MQRVLTVAEAADELKCSVSMIRKMIRTGELPASRVGRGVRVPVAAVEAIVGETPLDAAHDDWRAGIEQHLARLQRQVDDLRSAAAG